MQAPIDAQGAAEQEVPLGELPGVRVVAGAPPFSAITVADFENIREQSGVRTDDRVVVWYALIKAHPSGRLRTRSVNRSSRRKIGRPSARPMRRAKIF